MSHADRISLNSQETTANQPASKFHLELTLSQKQVHSLEIGATAVGAVAISLYEFKTRKLSCMASEMILIAEDVGTSVWASALKAARCAPKTNYYELKNGTAISFDRNVSLYSVRTDLVSIVDPIGNEAHLYGTGSRTVVRATAGERLTPLEFYDQAGVGIHVPVNHSDLASVVFENKSDTPRNIRLFNKLTNSFWTGNMRPLARTPDLLDRASHF